MKRLVAKVMSSYWLRSGLFSFAQKFSVLAFGLGSFLLLVREISEAQMGTWALYLSITTILEQARSGLLRNAMIRFLNAETQYEDTAIQSASLFINVVASLVTVIILAGLAQPMSAFWNDPNLGVMLYWHCFYVILLIPFLHAEFVQQARAEFHGVFVIYAVRQGFFFGCILYSFLNPKQLSLVHLVAFQNISLAIAAVVAYLVARKLLQLSLPINFGAVKQLWQYGKYVFGTSVSSMLYSNTDHLMIASLVSTTGVAYYNIAARISNLVDLPSTVAADALFPKSAKARLDNGMGEIKTLYEKAVGITLAIIVPVSLVIVFFPKLLINLLAGESYFPSATILQVTIAYGLFQPFLRQYGIIMDSIGKPKLNFRLILILASVNVLSNYLFISAFGTIGAAYGTLATFVVGFIISQIFLNKIIGVTVFSTLRESVKFYKLIFSVVTKKITKPSP